MRISVNFPLYFERKSAILYIKAYDRYYNREREVTVQIPLSRKGLRRKILGLNSNKGDTGMATFIISILLVIVIILVLRKMYRDKRSGKNSCGCGGSCAGCASAGICHQNTDRSDKSSGRKQK